MAVLSDNDRKAVWADLMADLSREREAIGTAALPLTKADLRAVVDALDTYLNDNAAAINTAIPQPGRARLSSAQKARFLMAVIAKRYLVGA